VILPRRASLVALHLSWRGRRPTCQRFSFYWPSNTQPFFPRPLLPGSVHGRSSPYELPSCEAVSFGGGTGLRSVALCLPCFRVHSFSCMMNVTEIFVCGYPVLSGISSTVGRIDREPWRRSPFFTFFVCFSVCLPPVFFSGRTSVHREERRGHIPLM